MAQKCYLSTYLVMTFNSRQGWQNIDRPGFPMWYIPRFPVMGNTLKFGKLGNTGKYYIFFSLKRIFLNFRHAWDRLLYFIVALHEPSI